MEANGELPMAPARLHLAELALHGAFLRRAFVRRAAPGPDDPGERIVDLSQFVVPLRGIRRDQAQAGAPRTPTPRRSHQTDRPADSPITALLLLPPPPSYYKSP